MSVCGDRNRTWFPQRRTCYPTQALRAAQRRFDELHSEESGRAWHDGTETSWAAEDDASHPFAHDDGVTLYVSAEDDNPDDDFLEAVN